MATPIVRTSTNQSRRSQEPRKTQSSRLAPRRLAAWVTEITLVVTSGLVPFGIGVYVNSRSDLNRVPLNPVLIITEKQSPIP